MKRAKCNLLQFINLGTLERLSVSSVLKVHNQIIVCTKCLTLHEDMHLDPYFASIMMQCCYFTMPSLELKMCWIRVKPTKKEKAKSHNQLELK